MDDVLVSGTTNKSAGLNPIWEKCWFVQDSVSADLAKVVAIKQMKASMHILLHHDY